MLSAVMKSSNNFVGLITRCIPSIGTQSPKRLHSGKCKRLVCVGQLDFSASSDLMKTELTSLTTNRRQFFVVFFFLL